MIIGAQKCATSWLHHHLRQHPAIMLPEAKDVELFSYSVNLGDEAFESWLERFQAPPGVQRVGDANAAYFWTATGSAWSAKPDLFNERIPQAIHSRMGENMQFVISLRDPVERAVSAFLHHIHHGALQAGERLLEVAAPLGIVDMGFYAQHLDNWLEAYPPDRFLILTGMPQGRTSAGLVLDAVFYWLGVASKPGPPELERPVFPGIPRTIEADGVWTPADHASLALYLAGAENRPRRQAEAGLQVCLVSGEELDSLREIFGDDQARFTQRLAQGDLALVDPMAGLTVAG